MVTIKAGQHNLDLSLCSKMNILLLVCFLPAVLSSITGCPDTALTNGTKPLYLLSLLPNRSFELFLLAPRIAIEEINNRSDILPGYHIELIPEIIEDCSSLEAGIGLNNMLKYTVNPPCRPVVAVMGLGCSSHTTVLSPVAGHEGFDLIQLSRASSPVFKTQTNRFPHLWRFVGDATLYADTIIAMMDHFNWTRIGVVYNLQSSLYSELAKYIEHSIKQSSNKSLSFSIGIRGTKSYYIDTAIYNIRSKEIGVIVSLLSLTQSHALLMKTLEFGLTYPYHIWIHVSQQPFYYNRYGGKKFLAKAAFHHFFLRMKYSVNKDSLLVSNQTYADYRIKFFKQLKDRYNLTRPYLIGSHYYDQVWAIALSINKSLPELVSRNLSISNYTIGQQEITAVIEEQIEGLSFQGASAWIEFDKYRSVPSPVEVKWIVENGTDKLSGIYNPLYPFDFHIKISTSNVPNDTVPQIYEYVLIPFPASVLLYCITGIVIVFTTVQLILYLYNRHKNVIKATSPHLSMLMFAGCYLFCVAAIQINTLGSFHFSSQVFYAMAVANYTFILNGASLIFLTLFIKQLRVYRIFTFWNEDLGKKWSNLALFLVILALSFLPNIVLAILIVLKPPTLSMYSYKSLKGSLPVVTIHTRIEPTSNYLFIGLAGVYITVFLLMVFYMGIRNRKIKTKNFNNSGQFYTLLTVLLIAISLTVSTIIIFLIREQEPIANIVKVVLLLVLVTACQLILFFKKIVTATCISETVFNQALSSLGNSVTAIRKFVFQ